MMVNVLLLSKDKGYTKGWACKCAPQKGQVQDTRKTRKYKNNKVVQNTKKKKKKCLRATPNSLGSLICRILGGTLLNRKGKLIKRKLIRIDGGYRSV